MTLRENNIQRSGSFLMMPTNVSQSPFNPARHVFFNCHRHVWLCTLSSLDVTMVIAADTWVLAAVQQMFDCLCQCAALNPDPSDEGELKQDVS